jgi:hypothetical protein
VLLVLLLLLLMLLLLLLLMLLLLLLLRLPEAWGILLVAGREAPRFLRPDSRR